MKVSEMIALLQKCDLDADVTIARDARNPLEGDLIAGLIEIGFHREGVANIVVLKSHGGLKNKDGEKYLSNSYHAAVAVEAERMLNALRDAVCGVEYDPDLFVDRVLDETRRLMESE